MGRLWTGKGDDGTTGLLFGGRAPKASPRFDAVGDVDEAQAAIGVARAAADRGSELDSLLVSLQRDLWVLMAELATADDDRGKLAPGSTLVTAEMVDRLGKMADEIGARFEPPREFVVPGQDGPSAALDLARTIVRRAERAAAAVAAADSQVIPYLNRLSSVLWTLARWVEGEPLAVRDT
jgi:cob(I)alamin adenosyltransferase